MKLHRANRRNIVKTAPRQRIILGSRHRMLDHCLCCLKLGSVSGLGLIWSACQGAAQSQLEYTPQPTPIYGAEQMQAESPRVVLGFGPIFRPTYEGSDDTKIRAFPYVDITGLWGGRAFISSAHGIGLNLIGTGPWRVGVALNYQSGRTSSDSDRLKGLDDIDGHAVASTFLKYGVGHYSVRLDVDKILGSDAGMKVKLSASYMTKVTPKLRLSVGPALTWANSQYMKNYFGVTPLEAARATSEGNPIEAYTPGSGLKDVEFNINANYQFSEHWGMLGHLGLKELTGDAKDSPLTVKKFQPSIGVGVLYRF
ncbi:MipA/OmpV family protein [Thioclava sp. BHET1]|nr:MipA/OmpV family protein [Thioclava sp. BHET1]